MISTLFGALTSVGWIVVGGDGGLTGFSSSHFLVLTIFEGLCVVTWQDSLNSFDYVETQIMALISLLDCLTRFDPAIYFSPLYM